MTISRILATRLKRINIKLLILTSFQLMLRENDSFLRLFVDDKSVDEVTDGFKRFVGKS